MPPAPRWAISSKRSPAGKRSSRAMVMVESSAPAILAEAWPTGERGSRRSAVTPARLAPPALMRHVLLSAVYAVILVTVLPALATAARPPALDAWVIVRAGRTDVHMSGSTRDIKAARAQQQRGESLLYVRRGG